MTATNHRHSPHSSTYLIGRISLLYHLDTDIQNGSPGRGTLLRWHRDSMHTRWCCCHICRHRNLACTHRPRDLARSYTYHHWNKRKKHSNSATVRILRLWRSLDMSSGTGQSDWYKIHHLGKEKTHIHQCQYCNIFLWTPWCSCRYTLPAARCMCHYSDKANCDRIFAGSRRIVQSNLACDRKMTN